MCTRWRDHKMHGSTPKGRSRHYKYYTTIRKVKGTWYATPAETVEEQIHSLLTRIGIDPESIPAIRKQYQQHLASLNGSHIAERIEQLRERTLRLKAEKAALARLYAQGQLTDKNYSALYREWKGKVFETEQQIVQLESDHKEVVDDLELALLLLTAVPRVFDRLEIPEQERLLRILFRRIIIDTQGKVVDFELNSPFVYLTCLTESLPPRSKNGRGGSYSKGGWIKQIPSGAI
jgi:hypothetical protein